MSGTVALKPTHLVGDHTAVAIADTAVPLTPLTGATGILVQAIDADLRYTLDGTTPVGGSVGFLLYDGNDPILIDLGDNVDVLNFIRDGSVSGELQYQWTR